MSDPHSLHTARPGGQRCLVHDVALSGSCRGHCLGVNSTHTQRKRVLFHVRCPVLSHHDKSLQCTMYHAVFEKAMTVLLRHGCAAVLLACLMMYLFPSCTSSCSRSSVCCCPLCSGWPLALVAVCSGWTHTLRNTLHWQQRTTHCSLILDQHCTPPWTSLDPLMQLPTIYLSITRLSSSRVGSSSCVAHHTPPLPSPAHSSPVRAALCVKSRAAAERIVAAYYLTHRSISNYLSIDRNVVNRITFSTILCMLAYTMHVFEHAYMQD